MVSSHSDDSLLTLAAEFTTTGLPLSTNASLHLLEWGIGDVTAHDDKTIMAAPEEAQTQPAQEFENGERQKPQRDARARVPKTAGRTRPAAFTGILIAVALLLTATAGVALSRFAPKMAVSDLLQDEDTARLEALKALLPLVEKLATVEEEPQRETLIGSFQEELLQGEQALQTARDAAAGSAEASQAQHQARQHMKAAGKILGQLREAVVVRAEELTGSILPLPPAPRWPDVVTEVAGDRDLVEACMSYITGLERNSNHLWRRSRLAGRYLMTQEQGHDEEATERVLQAMWINLDYLESSARTSTRVWDAALKLKRAVASPLRALRLMQRNQMHRIIYFDVELGRAAIRSPASIWSDRKTAKAQEERLQLIEALRSVSAQVRALLTEHNKTIEELAATDGIEDIEAANQRAQALENEMINMNGQLMHNYEREIKAQLAPEQIARLRISLAELAKDAVQLAELDVDAVRTALQDIETAIAGVPYLEGSGSSSGKLSLDSRPLISSALESSLKALRGMVASAEKAMADLEGHLADLREYQLIATPSRTEDIAGTKALATRMTRRSLDLVPLHKDSEMIVLKVELLFYLNEDLSSSAAVAEKILSEVKNLSVRETGQLEDLKKELDAVISEAKAATSLKALAIQATEAQAIALQMEDLYYEATREASE